MAREPVMLNVYDMVGEFTRQCIGSATQLFIDSYIRLNLVGSMYLLLVM